MGEDRSWMYNRIEKGLLRSEFRDGVLRFVDFALHQPGCTDGAKIKCPCILPKCRNRRYLEVDEVMIHLCRKGFIPHYEVWSSHGEQFVHKDTHVGESSNRVDYRGDDYIQMVRDAAGPEMFDVETGVDVGDEEPNPDAKKFYELLDAASKPLYPGSEKHTQLSFISRILNVKCESKMSNSAFSDILQLIKEVVPEPNSGVPENYYQAKKLMRGMGLPVEMIDCCQNLCMLYRKEDKDLEKCKFCDHPRWKNNEQGASTSRKKKLPFKRMHYFPLTPRLQRLYASKASASHMRWHAQHAAPAEGIMHHPSHSPAWKHVDNMYPDFASEQRNVRLGLCTDGFQPFGTHGKNYSSWPVMVTPYNLPPDMCMKPQFMFLSVLIPGPDNPKEKLDVFLQPLIDELIQLWEDGARTYDVSTKKNFQLKAVLLWTISDFPAYGMLSGWKTGGKLACPYCREETDAFTLPKSRKQSWFDSHRKFLPLHHPFRRNRNDFRKNVIVLQRSAPVHRSGEEVKNLLDHLGLKKVTELGHVETNKRVCDNCDNCGWKRRSIFWDLPYWSSLLIRHNLDFMHIEKNCFEQIFNTVCHVKDKTKDTISSREELNDICRRPTLSKDNTTGKYPKASYVLDPQSRRKMFDWLDGLRFPDGFASKMGRCVDLQKTKMFGMKSHDCHVFMQRLLPIALRELLPKQVWEPLTEFSMFFKDLGARVIDRRDMERLEEAIPVILCKLERFFPPSFFNSMEHLPVHMPYEAKVAGPVQYRWMYPFERYLRNLKSNVKNKNQVEGSMANAFLMEELCYFTSFYFEDQVQTKLRTVARNADEFVSEDDDEDAISLFRQSGRPLGAGKIRYLSDDELRSATLYVLLNCVQVEPFVEKYTSLSRQPQMEEFPKWFEEHVADPVNNVCDKYLIELSKGPFRRVTTYSGYIVNGYRFHTRTHATNMSTVNSGVCVKGTCYNADESDYYGLLEDVLQLEYGGFPSKKTFLFSCAWFDPSSRGMTTHPKYKIVEINHKRKYNSYEPFILAAQAHQVTYLSYPSLQRDKADWWVAIKIQARNTVSIMEIDPDTSFQEEVVNDPIDVDADEFELTLGDRNVYIELNN